MRSHPGLRIFCFLMALHILNLSVDSPDPRPNHIPEDLNFNDMESIVEIVLEQVLDIEDAIPEQEDDDTSHGLLMKTNFQPVFFQQQIGIEFMSGGDIAILHKNFFYYDPYSEQFHPEVVPPPPKA